ncbi:hypothetical protein BH708_08780 [Brachybacterium sp. P6-10-X1]|uniref:hypothetical protein n=1 Tax=Brachybacterium sp. P6-10-X1 TaxID=1903186 RepID=UPI0009718187|nr:hypothetical protein [Brachybacterium sp. P6-10-X1]APX32800.1 hypothetical protein BH708_08780 [Brachybacterium sp. P6-10-X1]
MKVTDTHGAAAGHFDYLEAETAPQTIPADVHDFPAASTEHLVDLVETTGSRPAVTGPVRIGAEPLAARSA